MNRQILEPMPSLDAPLEKLEAQSDRFFRPEIVRDIVLLPTEEGILLDGLPRVELIQGPVAQTVLPDLIALMDGTRTLQQLVAAFPALPPTYVHAAVSLLSDWGLIQDETDPVGANLETVAFLRRHIAGSGFRYSACESYVRLQDAEVIVVAANDTDDLSASLQLLLESTGVGSVRRVERDRFDIHNIAKRGLVVALSTDGEDVGWYDNLDELKWQVGISWLRSVVDQKNETVDVGPLFRPGDSNTCYRCFRNVHAFPVQNAIPHRLSSAAAGSWTSLLAIELTYILALPNLALNGREFRRFRFPDWDSHSLRYPRLPGCPRCRPHAMHQPVRSNHHKDERVTDTALVFEEYVGLESRDTLSPSVREQFAQSNSVAGHESKRLSNSEQIPLRRGNLELRMDTFAALRGAESSGKSRFTLDDLAAILALTGGIREMSGNKVRRWAATAGNLGSVEIFVAARQVDGLDPGLYFYQAAEHALAAFRRRGALAIDEFMARSIGRSRDQLPDALIVFTGALHRLTRKYGPFGYRLINLDAGCALSQLRLISRDLGLRSHTLTRWADDLITEQLNLRGFDEQLTAVVEVARRERIKTGVLSFLKRSVPKPDNPRPERSGSWKTAQDFRGLTLQEVSQALFKESRVKEVDLSIGVHNVPSELLNAVPSQPLHLKLPKPIHSGLPLGNVLFRRSSIRHYAQSPVSAQQIGTALHFAHSADAAEWSDDHRCGLPLSYLVLARNVSEIDAGVYEYDPARHGLVRVGSALSREQTVDLLVQSEYAEAPVLIWIAGNLAAACARHGASGHRQLLLRAGAAGHRLWMSTLGLGLAGSVFAGLIPGEARRLLGMDGYEKASLFAFTAGYELSGPEPRDIPPTSLA